jgi:hypothetical protein
MLVGILDKLEFSLVWVILLDATFIEITSFYATYMTLT